MNNAITLVEKCIEEEIQKNSKNGIKSLEILNLKTLERIINSKEEYVSSINAFELEANRNINYFSTSADKVLIMFTSDKTFDIGFDSEISDHRKVFNPLDGNAIKYEDLDKKHNKIVWIRLSDICKSKKVFSHDSLREIKCSIEFLLEQYPDFYSKLFNNQKTKTLSK